VFVTDYVLAAVDGVTAWVCKHDTVEDLPMSTGLKIRPQLDQESLRKAIFGAAPLSEQLERAIVSVHIEQDANGWVHASVLDTSGDDLASATAHALAHRIEMGRDGAAHVGVSMSDTSAWAKIGSTLLSENRRGANMEDIDFDATVQGTRVLLAEAFSDRFISEH